ncbi:LapA family protein [Pseudonocardia endophytica]|uniref:Putative integral membrane protein n=1 Tax=Pseudonocardia endophytica TaxID=401976 RepID=A0A4V2PIN2_PSEEN|nr:lipopolysaccharide assembly protein LapA domain-containing protein [Pseudonocardia endophytica]TCK25376.1 putative integral membrane protein [Pseudonocardia endophytica]
MNDERRERSGTPAYGRVGPADPTADPATHPAMRVPGEDGATVAVPVSEQPTVAVPAGDTETPGDDSPTRPARVGPQRSRIGGWWAGLVLSAVVGVLLLVFILQNTQPVQITFLWMSGTLPTGIALLFAAIAGILLVAIPGTWRILQLRRAARRRV